MEKTFSFGYKAYTRTDDMPERERELIRAAREACATAWAPYSNFRVGAAALLESGLVITGSNQESEVFPAGVCAERNLLFHHQAHHAGDPIVMLAIASVPGQKECYPCGICRQVINDTQNRQRRPIRVIMAGDESASVVEGAETLLPFTFRL